MHAPRPPANAILRPRLLQRLDAALSYPITLLAGPAGSGKSTLLAQWSACCPVPVARLALSERDCDPRHALARLGAALQAVQPSAPTAAPPKTLAAALAELVNGLAEVQQDLAVLVDQCHACEGSALAGPVAALLDYLPPRLHLVLAVRREPPWPLPRLRVRGQLLEIGPAELAFTPEETAAFLATAVAPEAARQAAEVHAWAEGWATGLACAAHALGRGAGLSACRPKLARYFRAEVMRRLPAGVQAFLRCTAALDPLTAPACNALTGRTDSAELLELLWRANLFVLPLDAERRAYRYHRLFAEFLQGEG